MKPISDLFVRSETFMIKEEETGTKVKMESTVKGVRVC